MNLYSLISICLFLWMSALLSFRSHSWRLSWAPPLMIDIRFFSHLIWQGLFCAEPCRVTLNCFSSLVSGLWSLVRFKPQVERLKQKIIWAYNSQQNNFSAFPYSDYMIGDIHTIIVLAGLFLRLPAANEPLWSAPLFIFHFISCWIISFSFFFWMCAEIASLFWPLFLMSSCSIHWPCMDPMMSLEMTPKRTENMRSSVCAAVRMIGHELVLLT